VRRRASAPLPCPDVADLSALWWEGADDHATMTAVPFLLIWAMYFLPVVDISVFPPMAHAPAAFRARAIIEKHPDNRLLIMEVDGPEYKSSQWVIEGAQRQRVFQWQRLELRSVGEYVAKATLIRITDGRERKHIATVVFQVRGFDPYAPPEW
jgi:hypothetical protein